MHGRDAAVPLQSSDSILYLSYLACQREGISQAWPGVSGRQAIFLALHLHVTSYSAIAQDTLCWTRHTTV